MNKIEPTFYFNGKPIGKIQEACITTTKDTLTESSFLSSMSKLKDGITVHLDSLKMSLDFKYQLAGYQIIEDTRMVDKKQAKIHHKKRINKKWLKRYGFVTTPQKGVYVFSNKIVGHPSVIKMMKDRMV